jgi:hypothetical protein
MQRFDIVDRICTEVFAREAFGPQRLAGTGLLL